MICPSILWLLFFFGPKVAANRWRQPQVSPRANSNVFGARNYLRESLSLSLLSNASFRFAQRPIAFRRICARTREKRAKTRVECVSLKRQQLLARLTRSRHIVLRNAREMIPVEAAAAQKSAAPTNSGKWRTMRRMAAAAAATWHNHLSSQLGGLLPGRRRRLSAASRRCAWRLLFNDVGGDMSSSFGCAAAQLA